MSKMLVELANLYRQLIYIWDKGVESCGGKGRSQGGVTRQQALRPFVRFRFIWAQRGNSGQKWAGQICNKVRERGRNTGESDRGVDLSLVPTHMCSKYRNSMDNNNGRAVPPTPSLSFSLLLLSLFLSLTHWIVATLCHLICCNLIDNLCNFNEHERFI